MFSANTRTAKEVLHALEEARAARGVTKAELARRSRLRAQTVRRLEPALAEALKLSREDAILARAIPVALQKNRGRLALKLLRDEAD
jgi:ribosome-binding protein aMBF1 (putative translation factor)